MVKKIQGFEHKTVGILKYLIKLLTWRYFGLISANYLGVFEHKMLGLLVLLKIPFFDYFSQLSSIILVILCLKALFLDIIVTIRANLDFYTLEAYYEPINKLVVAHFRRPRWDLVCNHLTSGGI